MKTKYKILIVSFQFLLLLFYIVGFAYQVYRVDREVEFVNIPIKYTKDLITGEEYGITISGAKGEKSAIFESDNFPGKMFEASYYMAVRFPTHVFRTLAKNIPHPWDAT